MQPEARFIALARRQGLLLHAKVLSRDECHLTPRRISRAAGARLRAGIAALEAYVRRLLLLLALALEPAHPRSAPGHVPVPAFASCRRETIALASYGRLGEI